MSGAQLWFDRWIYLDASQELQLPAELLLDFLGARGVLFSLEWAAVGPGAAGSPTGVQIDYLRSAARTAVESRFERTMGLPRLNLSNR
jgi:hypothetical protein